MEAGPHAMAKPTSNLSSVRLTTRLCYSRAPISQVTLNQYTKIVSVDKELLAMLQYSFAGSHCLRNIVPIGSEGGVGGSYLFGTLTFVTTKGTFCIGVGTTGFSIDGSVPGTNTEFYSPAGAELLSMLYCRRTGMPLPARHVSALNGQQFIDMQMYALHRSQWASNALGIEIEDASPPAK